jgi:hypothetical protein
MIYTGSIKDAVLLTVTDAPVIQFIYGTIVYDLSERFSPGDWIATSNLVKFNEVSKGEYVAVTQSSIYLIDGCYQELDIVWDAVTNIRTGTKPAVAVKLLEKVYGTKYFDSV